MTLQARHLIDGEWLGVPHATSINPADSSAIGRYADGGPEEAQAAIAAARRAFERPDWAQAPRLRQQVMLQWADRLEQRAEELAQLLTLENGKVLAQSRGEIGGAISEIRYYAGLTRYIPGHVFEVAPGEFSTLFKEPAGVCGLIIPWNAPVVLLIRALTPALAAGCTVVIKPAEATPYSAFALAELAHRAGFPPGVLNVLTGDASAIGGELCANPIVRKMSFTGSTEVGRILMKQVAPTIKKISLELGGNAPFIVFDDADLDAAAEGAIVSKYRNAGQTCVCANRIFVHERVHDAFATKLAERVRALKVGPGTETGVTQGPLINGDALAKVEEHVRDATSHGATVVTGGKRHPLGGNFYEPTVLAGVTADMQIFREETFGPVAPLISFRDDAEVVELANRTEFGLASYFYSRDIGRIWRVAEALEYGMVGVNTGLITTEVAPFGGVKQSGLGREGSKYGIEEYVEVKYVCFGGVDR